VKVAINACYGGFSFSPEAMLRLHELGVPFATPAGAGREVERHDPRVIQVIEEMGDKADGPFAKLRIVEIPDGTDYEVSEYDGNEHIAEKHQTWS
jgi:hypothetical protein